MSIRFLIFILILSKLSNSFSITNKADMSVFFCISGPCVSLYQIRNSASVARFKHKQNKNTDMSVSWSFQEPVFICIMKQWKYCKVIIEVREVEVIKEKEVVKTAPQRKSFKSYLICIFASIFLLLALYFLIRNRLRL